jgi:LuxR family maltose regulon positive regulatory protein
MGRFYTRLGLTGKIASWLRTENEAGELKALPHSRSVDTLVKAWCLFIEKDYEAALRVLEEEKKKDDLSRFILGLLSMTVLESAIRLILGSEAEALQTLEAAYLMAAPNSLDMPFIELGEHIRPLIKAALAGKEGRMPRSWLENIRSRASAYGKQAALTAEQYRREDGEIQKEPVYLTRQERKVLSGLSRGLKQKDIALETGLSPNTVKVAIGALYGKLGALNQADAIRIASSLGIMDEHLL